MLEIRKVYKLSIYHLFSFVISVFTAKKQLLFQAFFYAFLAAALLAPLANDNAIPNLADFINHLAMVIQAKSALMEGQFPLRIAPLEHSGWRYPFFQFYSPTAYLIAGAIYRWIVPSNPILAYKLTMWCGLVIGGIYINRLSFWLTQSRPAALLASVVYLYAPYYIIVIDQLGSLNEAVALGIIPVVLFYTLQQFYHPKKDINFLMMIFTWYLLLTVHIVTFVYTSFFAFLLLSLLTLKKIHYAKNLLLTFVAYGFACILAMWYLIPVLFLKKYFNIGVTYNQADYIYLFHPFFSQLLFSSASLTAGIKSSAALTIHPSVGWPILFAVGICCYAFFDKQSIKNQWASDWIPVLLLLFFMAFILAWSPINFWQWLPHSLLVGQRSWRIMSQLIWVGALLFAWAVCWLFQNKLSFRHVIIGTLLIGYSATAWFPTLENTPIPVEDFIKHPFLLYNNNGYLLNFNQNSNLVDQIDSVLLANDPQLKLNKTILIPNQLLHLAKNPQITVSSEMTGDVEKKPIQLIATIDGSVLTKELKPGNMQWNIPLKETQSDTVSIRFSLHHPQADMNLPIKNILLTGFINQNEIMNVEKMQSYCHQQRAITLCQVPVASGITMLELPILYYPKLFSITINGKPVSYNSILTQGYLMTSVTPEANKINTIRIEFIGLPWANSISHVGFGLYMLLIVFAITRWINWGRIR